MEAKTCATCKISKSVSLFDANKSKKDGLASQCKSCRKESNKAYYLKTPHKNLQRRANSLRSKKAAKEYVWEYLRNNPCVDCGESDIIVLEFDHLKDKLFNVARMVSQGFGLPAIKAEIEKCEVRCANCHRRKTFERAGWLKK